MHQFTVQFRCLVDVQDFVAIASRLSHKLLVGHERFQVHATSFMGMFALNCRKPLRVTVDCSEEEFRQIRVLFERFLVA